MTLLYTEPTVLELLAAQLEDPTPDWRGQRACGGLDTELFYPGRGEATPLPVRIACAECDVRIPCLAYGLWEKHGVWGGISEKARRRLRRQLPASVRVHIDQVDAAGHGTAAGYRAHLRRHELACDACRQANAAYTRQLRLQRSEAC